MVLLENVSKKYQIGSGRYHSLREDIIILFKRIFALNSKNQNSIKNEIWALKDVSFKVGEGEAVGIIGPNGAGKSTTLKLISGIVLPTKGRISVQGSIAPLIEITAGLHPELTGIENLYLNASILGMRKKEIKAKLEKIVEFAEIQQFLDTPVKRYSSGMRVRLGYAIIANMNPDILLIDEVLSVGDLLFQRKCLENISNFRKEGKTVIFISHNLSAVKGLCDRVIWLDKGVIKKEGNPSDVIGAYTSHMTSTSQFVNDISYVDGKTRWGTGEARFINVEVLSSDGYKTDSFIPGDKITVLLEYEAYKKINSPVFWVGIINDNEVKVFGTYYNKNRVGEYSIKGKGILSCTIDSLLIRPGVYYVMAGIYDELGNLAIDRIGRAAAFRINDEKVDGLEKYHGYGAEGTINLPHLWKHN